MGTFVPGRECMPLVFKAQAALSLTQEELGERLGVSRRTVSRWNNRSTPDADDVQRLAVLVHPVDPELAAQLAKAGGCRLEDLGIAVAVPRQRPVPPTSIVVDAIVCVAAEAMHVAPDGMRAALRAAFARARALGLSVEDVDDVLSASSAPSVGDADASVKPRSHDPR